MILLLFIWTFYKHFFTKIKFVKIINIQLALCTHMIYSKQEHNDEGKTGKREI